MAKKAAGEPAAAKAAARNRGGRPKKPEGEARLPWFKFRVTPAEEQLIKSGAAAAGVTASELAREATLRQARRAIGEGRGQAGDETEAGGEAMTITCLSVRQPWATAIVYSAKWCENRSKRSHFVGEVWIHASSRWDDGRDAGDASDRGHGPEPESEAEAVERFGHPTPTGALVGRARMLGCWPAEQLEFARAGRRPDDPRLLEALDVLAAEPRNFYGWDYVAGPWCYLLADRVPLAEPVTIKGRLGLWTAEVDPRRLRLAPPTGQRRVLVAS